MKIIGYTYCADIHCPACAAQDAAVGILKRMPPLSMGTDEHGLAFDLIDREGNPIRPVFDIDEDVDGAFTHCGDCYEEL